MGRTFNGCGIYGLMGGAFMANGLGICDVMSVSFMA